jgi:hypothetical protein
VLGAAKNIRNLSHFCVFLVDHVEDPEGQERTREDSHASVSKYQSRKSFTASPE